MSKRIALQQAEVSAAERETERESECKKERERESECKKEGGRETEGQAKSSHRADTDGLPCGKYIVSVL